MDLDVGLAVPQEPVLVPVRLTDHEHIAGRLQIRHVGRLVRGVADHQDDVDQRLGRQSRTDVDPTCSTCTARGPSAARIRSSSRLNCSGQVGSGSASRTGPSCPTGYQEVRLGLFGHDASIGDLYAVRPNARCHSEVSTEPNRGSGGVMEADERDGRLAALDVFVGEWVEQVEIPDAPPGRCVFEWDLREASWSAIPQPASGVPGRPHGDLPDSGRLSPALLRLPRRRAALPDEPGRPDLDAAADRAGLHPPRSSPSATSAPSPRTATGSRGGGRRRTTRARAGRSTSRSPTPGFTTSPRRRLAPTLVRVW